MVRWITFDDETAATLVKSVASGAAEIRDGDAFDAALREPDCTLLLPSDSPGFVLLVRMHVRAEAAEVPKKPPVSEAAPTAEDPVLYEAVGFLGLSDSPIYEAEPPRHRKWWQKLLD